MNRSRCIQLCILPPPRTGHTLSDELATRALERRFEVQRVHTSRGALRSSLLGRTWRNARVLAQARGLRRELRLRPAELLCLVPSSTPFGRIRDALCIHALRPQVGRVLSCVHSGDYWRCFTPGPLAGLARRMVEEVDLFVFLSEGLSESCAPWIPASKRRVVPNWIDEELRVDERTAAAKIATGAPRKTLRVVFVSNMLKSKGYRELTRALVVCRERRRVNLEADFLGSFEDLRSEAAFRRTLRDSGLADVVCVHGGVEDRSAIRRVLERAHVLVLPTRHRVEAQPRAVIEALNAATPVVAAPRAAIPEMVYDDVNGYLVDPEVPEQIADALERLAVPDTWREKAAAARRVYREQFDPVEAEARFLAAAVGESEELAEGASWARASS